MPDSTKPPAKRPRPAVPNSPIVIAANQGLLDPNFRDSVRQMHAEGYPLTKMVEALGLDDELIEPVRTLLDNLSPDVVEGIRQATLAMLDTTNYVMPLDCTVTDAELNAGVKAEVEVLPENGVQTIHVRPVQS